MRNTLITVVCASAAFLSTGCVIHEYREGPPPVVETETVVDAPGIVVYEEPAPVERVYVYEPGYPPGCYFWGGFCYYGGRRYERDVFETRVVNVNIHERRYVNVEENRSVGRNIEVRHRDQYVRTGGHVSQQRQTGPQHQATEHQTVNHSTQTQRPVLVPGIQPAPPPPRSKPKDPNHPNQ